MPIQFVCPSCRTSYSVENQDAGRKVECKVCGQRVQVPSSKRLKTVLGEEVIPHGASEKVHPQAPAWTQEVIEPRPKPAPVSEPEPLPTNEPIRFACPKCHTTYTVRTEDAGKKSDCAKCGQRLQVPTPPAKPARPKTILGDYIPPGSPVPHPAPVEDEPIKLEPAREGFRPDESPSGYDGRPSSNYDDWSTAVPGKVQAINWMMLGGAAISGFGALLAIFLSAGAFLCWPGTYYAIVVCILGLVKAIPLVNKPSGPSPKSFLIMQIICAVNLDPFNTAAGIVGLVFLSDPAVSRWYARHSQRRRY